MTPDQIFVTMIECIVAFWIAWALFVVGANVYRNGRDTYRQWRWRKNWPQ